MLSRSHEDSATQLIARLARHFLRREMHLASAAHTFDTLINKARSDRISAPVAARVVKEGSQIVASGSATAMEGSEDVMAQIANVMNTPTFQLVALLEHATRHLNSFPSVLYAAGEQRGGADFEFLPRLFLHGLLEDTLLGLSHCEINCPDDTMLQAKVSPTADGHWMVPDAGSAQRTVVRARGNGRCFVLVTSMQDCIVIFVPSSETSFGGPNGEFIVHLFECHHGIIAVPERLQKLECLTSVGKARDVEAEAGSKDRGQEMDGKTSPISAPLSTAARTFFAALSRLHEFNVARTVYQSLRHGCTVASESSDRTRRLCSEHNHAIDVSELLNLRIRLQDVRRAAGPTRGDVRGDARIDAAEEESDIGRETSRIDTHFRAILAGRFAQLDSGEMYFDCPQALPQASLLRSDDRGEAEAAVDAAEQSPASAPSTANEEIGRSSAESAGACQPLFLSFTVALCRTRATPVGNTIKDVEQYTITDSIAGPLRKALANSRAVSLRSRGRTEIRMQLLSLPVMVETFSYLERAEAEDLNETDSTSSASTAARRIHAMTWSSDRSELLQHLSTTSITVSQSALIDECRQGLYSLVNDDVLETLGQIMDVSTKSDAAATATATASVPAATSAGFSLTDAHIVRRCIDELSVAKSPSVRSRKLPIKLVPTLRLSGAAVAVGGLSGRSSQRNQNQNQKREQIALLALAELCNEILRSFNAVQINNSFVLRVAEEEVKDDEAAGTAATAGSSDASSKSAAATAEANPAAGAKHDADDDHAATPESEEVGGSGTRRVRWGATWALLHLHPSSLSAERRVARLQRENTDVAIWALPRLAGHITISLHHNAVASGDGAAAGAHECSPRESVATYIMNRLEATIERVVHRTNQKLLLYQLHESRVCSPLLISPSSSSDMAINVAQTIAKRRREQKQFQHQQKYDLSSPSVGVVGLHHGDELTHFEVDEFACACRHRIRLPLQDRLTYSTALQAVNDVLAPFAARELDVRSEAAGPGRERFMYVYRDSGDRVFYLILSAMQRLGVGDSVMIVSDNKTRLGLNVGEIGKIVKDDHDSRPFTVRRENGALTSCYTESELMRANSTRKQTAATSTRRPLLELAVLGVDECSNEVAVDLTAMLVDKIATMSVAVLSGLLLRNPLYPHFQPTDIAFVRPPGAPPAAASRMLLPAPLTAPRCSIRAFVLTMNQKLTHFFTPFALTTAFQAEAGVELSERLVFEDVDAAGRSRKRTTSDSSTAQHRHHQQQQLPKQEDESVESVEQHEDDLLFGLSGESPNETVPLDPRVWHPALRHYRVMQSRADTQTTAGDAAAKPWNWNWRNVNPMSSTAATTEVEEEVPQAAVARRLSALASPVFTGLRRILERRVAVFASAGSAIGDAPPAPADGKISGSAATPSADRRGVFRRPSSSRGGGGSSTASSSTLGSVAAAGSGSTARNHSVSVIYIGLQERSPGAFVYAAFTSGFTAHRPPFRDDDSSASAGDDGVVIDAMHADEHDEPPKRNEALAGISTWTPARRLPLEAKSRPLVLSTAACASRPRFDLTACVWCRGELNSI